MLFLWLLTYFFSLAVKISGKPTYSTRRRKTSSKPKASSVFLRANSEGQLSGQSDSLPPSPVSSTYSFPSSETSVGGRSNSMTSEGSRKEAEHKLRRTLSIGSTGSDSSYESETESHGSSTNEIRSQKMAMKQESSSSMIAPPVKLVSGAATIRKRLYASVPGKRFVAVKDYEPTRAGELALVKGDDVEGRRRHQQYQQPAWLHYRQTSLFRSSTGHEEKFEIAGFRNNHVLIASDDGQNKAGIRLDFEAAGTSNYPSSK